ncbi:hypothetical protein LCGC14_3052870, partial [marine sediment metagenome]
MRRRFKLVRICDGKYLSANQREITPTPPNCLEYKVGEVTRVGGMGIACYKTLAYADKTNHIKETRHHFNGGDPIAIIELEPIGLSGYGSYHRPI